MKFAILEMQMSHLPAYVHTYPYIVETVFNDTGFMVVTYRRKTKIKISMATI